MEVLENYCTAYLQIKTQRYIKPSLKLHAFVCLDGIPVQATETGTVLVFQNGCFLVRKLSCPDRLSKRKSFSSNIAKSLTTF